MPNRAAHRLTNPLAIGAYYAKEYGLVVPADHPRMLTGAATTQPEQLICSAWQKACVGRFSAMYEEERAILTTPWRIRASNKVVTETHKEIPYERLELVIHAHKYLIHFPHIDPQDPTKIRYFQSEEHGQAERYTTTTLGKYLTAHYPHLQQNEIRDIAAAYTSGKKRTCIKILYTADDIQAAYLDGPQSCMSKSTGNYSTHGIHPVRAYGDSDLALAVMYNKGHVTARALVWPERMKHGRIYGDWREMREELNNLGYRHGSFENAKINAIKHPTNDDCLVCPYIDSYYDGDDHNSNGAMIVFLNDDKFTLSERDPDVGSYDDYEWGENERMACRTDGTVHIERLQPCPHCEENVASRDLTNWYRTPTELIHGCDSCCPPCANVFVHSRNENITLQTDGNVLGCDETHQMRVTLVEDDNFVFLDRDIYRHSYREFPRITPANTTAQIERDDGTTTIVRQCDASVTTGIHQLGLHARTVLTRDVITVIINRETRSIATGQLSRIIEAGATQQTRSTWILNLNASQSTQNEAELIASN